jgi:periplasmic protein CpxP/Spy
VGSAAVLRAIDFGSQNQIISQAPDRPGKQRGMGLMRDLNLSSEQMTQIQQIRSRYRDQLERDRKAARQAQQELRSLMAGNTATEQQIKEKFRQVQSLRTQAAEAQFNSMVEMRNVLTPEQRQKFAERMEKRRGDMRERFRGSDGYVNSFVSRIRVSK